MHFAFGVFFKEMTRSDKMLARVKQFFLGVFQRPQKKDIDFVYKYLDERERKVFFSLPYYEQMHALRVAEYVKEKSNCKNIQSNDIIKASLLHDSGKGGSGLNLITKSIMVILDAVFHERLKKFSSYKIVNAYYNHGKIAADNLSFESNRIRYLILNHHNFNINDEELNLLQEADNKN